ncbi:MAG: hypothetical protein CL796_01260 [Chloroflexi bacterium]|nr:hypothetical protein [Chloroflexota bacterium]|tara:strand:+ start:10657 stop:10872 length:216 start_codon:yes stop_codon:yes gene_type:complete
MLSRFLYSLVIPLISVITVAILAVLLGYIFYNLPRFAEEGELKNFYVVLVGMVILIGTPVSAYLAVKIFSK